MTVNNNSSASSDDFNLGAAAAEFGAAGTFATVAVHASTMGIGQVVVATLGASALTVSLPAVVAVGAASVLGLSLGSKVVKAINTL